jgi:DNA-binding GntR family transcriptional regulator
MPSDVNAPTEDHTRILLALKERGLQGACLALERHIQMSVQLLQRSFGTAADGETQTALVVGARRASPT